MIDQIFRDLRGMNLSITVLCCWLLLRIGCLLVACVTLFITGPAKRRAMEWRVILENYDFGKLCVNHAQTTPTLSNDHTQFLNSLDVFLNASYIRVIFDVAISLSPSIMKMSESYHFFITLRFHDSGDQESYVSF